MKSRIDNENKSRSVKWISWWSDTDETCLFLLASVGLFVRSFVIYNPSLVVFDEVHFGGFASNYLNNEHYLDVHPPLAKLLVALTGWLSGLNASFRFGKIGLDYVHSHVPFVLMRLVSCVLGVLVILLSYIISRCIGMGIISSAWTAFLVMFENQFVTQFRLILLDSYLTFGIIATITSYLCFLQIETTEFSFGWWTFLSLTGFFLGFTISCKFVGLFTLLTIGIFTIVELWKLVGDQTKTLDELGMHVIARTVCLILIPVAVFLGSFYLHLLILSKYGSGAESMSLEFQQGLRGGERDPTFRDVFYEGNLTIRHYKTTKYLHSHHYFYPEGSQQQQVTLYSFPDENNQWRLIPGHDSPYNNSRCNPLRHGDIVRFEHVTTGRYLHSHQIEPPISNREHHNEVSCYGSEHDGIGDTNDNWMIIVTDACGNEIHDPNKETPMITARNSFIRLVHPNTGCKLGSFDKTLPDWGFEQGEVICGRETRRDHCVWVIEDNDSPCSDTNSPRTNYPTLTFWQKLIELLKIMWALNSQLTDKHPFGSRPSSWFWLTRGIGFWIADQGYSYAEEASTDDIDIQMKNQGKQIYLMGNPFVWWTVSLTIIFYCFCLILIIITDIWNVQMFSLQSPYRVSSVAGIFLVGYLMHYLPFFLMERQLFLHHYIPAYMFGIILSTYLIDVTLKTYFASSVQYSLYFVFSLGVVYHFWIFAPLSYGLEMSLEHCQSIKWIDSWDFDCRGLRSILKPMISAV